MTRDESRQALGPKLHGLTMAFVRTEGRRCARYSLCEALAPGETYQGELLVVTVPRLFHRAIFFGPKSILSAANASYDIVTSQCISKNIARLADI